jgi:hypothetical protein
MGAPGHTLLRKRRGENITTEKSTGEREGDRYERKTNKIK